jgi:hypothetical protein
MRHPILLSQPDHKETLASRGAALIMSIGDHHNPGTMSARTAKILEQSGIPAVDRQRTDIVDPGAFLAYSIWKFGFRSIQDQAFETDSLDHQIRRNQDRIWRSSRNLCGGIQDQLGIVKAANAVKSWLIETITGSPAPSTKPADPTQSFIVYLPGPAKPMTIADFDELPYIGHRSMTYAITTPMTRAFATMDMIIADLGVGPVTRFTDEANSPNDS